jgi:hypothetical protein
MRAEWEPGGNVIACGQRGNYCQVLCHSTLHYCMSELSGVRFCVGVVTVVFQ